MPTRRGWATLGAAAGCVIAARLAYARELYSVGIAAGLLPLLAILVVRRGSVAIAVERKTAARKIFPGARVRVELTVKNASHLRTPPLLVEDEASPAFGGPARFSLSSLPAQAQTTVAVERTASTRGRYALGPVRVRLVDPFGLAERSVTVNARDRVTVYPAITPLTGGGPPAERAGAGPASEFRVAPEGDEFYAVREYESGDDLRKIHWRSVARSGKLMIRQEEARFFPRATVFADLRRAVHRGDGADSSVEWVVSAAASIIWHLSHQGFALRLASEEIAPGGQRRGRDASESLLESLAIVQPSSLPSLSTGLRRLGRRPGAEGALLAILPVPASDDLRALARLSVLYSWCGAILVDAHSFTQSTPRDRASADQRLAAAEATLARAGWRVRTAGSKERIREVWHELTGGTTSRPSSSSARW